MDNDFGSAELIFSLMRKEKLALRFDSALQMSQKEVREEILDKVN